MTAPQCISAPAWADCDSDIAVYNALVSRANALIIKRDEISCDDPDFSQRELLPLYSQGIPLQQKVIARCPGAKIGSTVAELQAGLKKSREFSAKCQRASARKREVFVRARQKVEQALEAQQPNDPPGPPTGGSSCSDITGTGSAAPAPAHCKDAGTLLHSARVIRQIRQKGYGPYAQEQYKKAVDEYRLAGDLKRAANVLREAALSDEAFAAQQQAAITDPVREDRLRSANNMMKAGRSIEESPHTCPDLRDAAAFYLGAATNFLAAGDKRKTDELLLRHDWLIDEVDKLEAQHRCRQVTQARMESPPDGVSVTDKCKPFVEAVKKIRSIGGSGDDFLPLDAVGRQQGCEVRTVVHALDQACLKMHLSGKLTGDDLARRLTELGCPPK